MLIAEAKTRITQPIAQGAAPAFLKFVPPILRVMWGELAERHHAFWAGTSWDLDQESQELSYSLADVLVHLLGEERSAFLAFVSHAHYDDAGQTAALDCLGVSLGDAAGTFLGEGNRRPVRKAMVECWGTENPQSENGSDAQI